MNRIGKYTAIKQLGAGGFGAVYLAEDKLGEQVAIKVFQIRDENLARQATSSSTDAVEVLKQRFMSEARTLRKLSANPYIVEMYDFDELEDGTPYYVMPYLAKSLEQEIGKDAFTRGKLEETPPELHPRRLPVTRSLEILTQVLEGLSAVHRAGLIHRDIKPANILLGSEGQVQICDFGIAKVPDVEHSMSGVGMGSRHYMSPEQRESAKYVEPQSDVYSVGVLAFRMLTGTLPTLTKQSLLDFVPEAGSPLAALIEQSMELDPRSRPNEGGDFLKQLRKARDGVDANAPEGGEDTGTFTDVGQADFIRDELRPLKERIEQLLAEHGHIRASDRSMLETMAAIVELDAEGLDALIKQVREAQGEGFRRVENFLKVVEARLQAGPLSPTDRTSLLDAAEGIGLSRARAEGVLVEQERQQSSVKQRSEGSAIKSRTTASPGRGTGGVLKGLFGLVLVAALGGGVYWIYIEQQAAAERERVAESQRIRAEAEARARAESEENNDAERLVAEQARRQQDPADRNARDDAAFKVAATKDTREALEVYLDTWPEGQHVIAASERLVSLKAQAKSAAEAQRLAEVEAAAYRTLVMNTQRELTRLGYDVGSADGVAGKKTASAIRSFESWAGRDATGAPSADLLELLRRTKEVGYPLYVRGVPVGVELKLRPLNDFASPSGPDRTFSQGMKLPEGLYGVYSELSSDYYPIAAVVEVGAGSGEAPLLEPERRSRRMLSAQCRSGNRTTLVPNVIGGSPKTTFLVQQLQLAVYSRVVDFLSVSNDCYVADIVEMSESDARRFNENYDTADSNFLSKFVAAHETNPRSLVFFVQTTFFYDGESFSFDYGLFYPSHSVILTIPIADVSAKLRAASADITELARQISSTIEEQEALLKTYGVR
jgi:serine/threonine protein kinase